MSKTARPDPTTSQTGEVRNIIYTYGKSTLGDFIAAVDRSGLCAILFGDSQTDLFDELGDAFPKRVFTQACPTYGGFLATAVVGLIQRPSMSLAFPISIDDGDFGQMVRAALRFTKAGETITPEEIAEMIGASPLAAANVRECAKNDLVAVAVPFHRMQEQDGSSPAYRWGEDRRRALLDREAAT